MDNPTSATQGLFDAALDRIKSVTGTRTQVELAELLGIRQSSISDAKRRGSIPSDWLVKLLKLHGLNPEWIVKGDAEPQYLVPSKEAQNAFLAQVDALESERDELSSRVASLEADLASALDNFDARAAARYLQMHQGHAVLLLPEAMLGNFLGLLSPANPPAQGMPLKPLITCTDAATTPPETSDAA